MLCIVLISILNKKNNPVIPDSSPQQNTPSALQDTPELIQAVTQNKWLRVQQLLKEGNDINIQDNEGNTALHHVILNNTPYQLNLLLISNTTKDKIDPNIHNNNNETPLYLAIIKGLKEEHLRLIKDKSDINVRDANGATALIKATQNPEATPEILNKLIKLGADVNAQDNEDQTALIKESIQSKPREPIMHTLLVHNADPNLADKDGRTALINITTNTTMKGNERDIQYNILDDLLQHGAQVSLKDNTDQNALDYARNLPENMDDIYSRVHKKIIIDKLSGNARE